MKPEIDAASIVRAYLWEVLKENDPNTWDTDKYGGLVPIVPLGEVPEVTEYSGPHIIYAHSHAPAVHPRSEGGMVLVIADNNFRRMSKTINIVESALNREHESARDINKFSSTHLNGAFVGIRFGWCRTLFAEGPTPSETEGGRDMAYLDVEYEYYVDYDVTTDIAKV